MNREKGLFRLAVVLFPVFGIVGVVVNNSFTGEVVYSYVSYIASDGYVHTKSTLISSIVVCIGLNQQS